MRAGRIVGDPAPRQRRLGAGLLLAGLAVVSAWALVSGWQLVGHARSLRGHLASLEALEASGWGGMGLDDVRAIGPHLAGMRLELEAIGAEAGYLLGAGRLLGWLPGAGGDLAAAYPLLQAATGMAAAGDRSYQALAPAVELLSGPGGEPAFSLTQAERVLPLLAAAGAELRAARAELGTAAAWRGQVPGQRLSPRTAGLLARFDGVLPWFEAGLDAALLAPDLLGADGPRTYLVLAQNNQELRATGGFISGVGELEIEAGRIRSLSFGDSYAVDNLQVGHELTPLDVQQTLFGQLWFFRDANWEPDYPTSAGRLLDIYERDRGVRAEGVITLDLRALELLVDAVGPLTVAGLGEAVTGANVMRVVQEQWGGPGGEGGADWWLHRKDFMGEIAAAALGRLALGEDVDGRRLLGALNQALEEKHVLVYLADPGAAALLRDRNWDGALPAPAAGSDVLMVVDSNVGFNKADARVERAVHYRVDLGAEGGSQAELAVTYHHRTTRPVGACVQEARYGERYADMIDRCYWDYLRVYTPGGSRLLAGPELPWPPGSLAVRADPALSEEPFGAALAVEGWAVWTSFFDLEPGDSRTFRYRYALPVGVLKREADGAVRYSLRVQKQPGTEAVPLQVELVLPAGARIREAAPADLPLVSTDLRVDRELTIVYDGGAEKR